MPASPHVAAVGGSVYLVLGPEVGAPIDGWMKVRAIADDAGHCRTALLNLMADPDDERVFLVYRADISPASELLELTLGDLLEDPGLAAIHLIGISQAVRHKISGLEAAASLFGVFGSDYLVLGAHVLGLSPPELVSMLESDQVPPTTQKLIAALVAHGRPDGHQELIEAVERVDLMPSSLLQRFPIGS
ncbi:MAG: hypothetical protein ACFB6S_11305 [Geminicoccaceae bacterium]